MAAQCPRCLELEEELAHLRQRLAARGTPAGRADAGATYAVRLTTRQWQHIDGTLDHEVSGEAERGDPRGVVERGSRIREAGWNQVAQWTPGVPGSGAWPPADQPVTVTPTGAQWALVRAPVAAQVSGQAPGWTAPAPDTA